MAINLMLDNDNENIPIQVEDGNPYYVGARAYVEQLPTGAKITVIDKEGTTTAIVDDGAAAGFGTVTASVDANVGTPSVTVTTSGTDTAKNFDFAFKNLKGAKGDTGNTGAAAGFGTVSATVDANVGTPSVTVTASGSDTAKNFDFDFKNLKGDKGDTGEKGDTGDVNMAQLQAVLVKETKSGAIASFNDGADNIPMVDLTADLEPIQDLNGYDKPWSGGAGKNKLPYDLTYIKSINTGGTWSDDVYTRNGLTFTLYADGTVKVNGTASAETFFNLNLTMTSYLTSGTSYIINGCPSGGSASTYVFALQGFAYDTGSGATGTASSSGNNCYLQIKSGAQLNNLVFKPMVRLATVTDATYEPYENICPISGRTEVVTSVCGKNLLPVTPQYTSTAISFDRTKCVRLIKDRQYKFSFASMTNATSWRLLFTLFDLAGNKIEASSTSLTITTSGLFTACDKTLYWNASFKGFIQGANGTDTSVSFTPADDYYLHIAFSIGDSSASTVMNEPQVELGSTATTYEPYNGDTYTTSLGTTVYGGTLDVVSGVLTVDRAIVDLGTLTWYMETSGMFYAYITDRLKSADIKSICSAYPWSGNNAGFPTDKTYNWLQYHALENVYVADSAYSDATSFKTAMNGVQLCYELATPTTTTLTAQQISTLLGQNNVWASSGDVTVIFCADTALYIANALA